MNRRAFVRSLAAAPAAGIATAPARPGGAPKMKITKVKVWTPPNPNPLFNQSDMVVTVETDAGITGIGEGAAPRTCWRSAPAG